MLTKTYGQIAYEAWFNRISKRVQPQILIFGCEWEHASDEVKRDWEEVAKEVINSYSESSNDNQS